MAERVTHAHVPQLAPAPILGVFIDKQQAGAEPGGGIKEPCPRFDKYTLSFKNPGRETRVMRRWTHVHCRLSSVYPQIITLTLYSPHVHAIVNPAL